MEDVAPIWEGAQGCRRRYGYRERVRCRQVTTVEGSFVEGLSLRRRRPAGPWGPVWDDRRDPSLTHLCPARRRPPVLLDHSLSPDGPVAEEGAKRGRR